MGLWLSALNVEYRDVRYIVPFLIQIWLFVTPVIYPASRVARSSEHWACPTWLYGLNPMVGVVEGFRWALLGRTSLPGRALAASAVVRRRVLVSRRLLLPPHGRTFADVV